MKKQKKKIKKKQLKLTTLKINKRHSYKRKSRDTSKGCGHYHIDANGSCCHCGELNALFKGLNKN